MRFIRAEFDRLFRDGHSPVYGIISKHFGINKGEFSFFYVTHLRTGMTIDGSGYKRKKTAIKIVEYLETIKSIIWENDVEYFLLPNINKKVTNIKDKARRLKNEN